MADTLSTASSSDIRQDYMTLLVTQLQNQNPLEPMSNDQMSMQLAQFSQLEQLETMNTRFADVLGSLDQAYASDLLGKQITFQSGEDDEAGAPAEGVVDAVQRSADDVHLLVGNYRVNLADVLSVTNP